MFIMPPDNIPDIKIEMPEHIVPQYLYIPKYPHYNANNKRKKGKKK